MAALRNRMRRALKPWRQANRMARWLVVSGLVITTMFALLAVFADQIAPYGEDQYRAETAGEDGEPVFESLPRRQAPGEGFPFGTTSARLDSPSGTRGPRR